MAKTPDEEAAGAHTVFTASMSYGDYLKLDPLLACQQPVSDQHDEMLFIVIHQATELWLKLAIHELKATISGLEHDDLQPAFKNLARVSRIQSQLIQSWDILSTLTPTDYLKFRDKLGQSSGFQSHQYRMMEFLLGNKRAALLAPHRHRPDLHAALTEALEGRTAATRPCWRPGRRYTGTPPSTGTSTSWPRSWWTWKTGSSNGVSAI
jgi:tryptophan 2,3-dioxygenase